MNIIVKAIEMEGFKSFLKPTRVEIPEVPGVYAISGINEQDTVEGNGAGKTSIMDAFVWCLCGLSQKKVKANSLKSWGYSGATRCRIEFVNADTGEECWVERRDKPVMTIRLKSNGSEKVLSQEELQAALGFDPDFVMQSIALSQFESTFLLQSPTERRNSLSAILSQYPWDDYRDVCVRAKTDFKRRLEEEDRQISRITDSIAELNAKYDELCKKHDEEVKNYKVMIQKVSDEKEQVYLNLKGAEGSLAKVEAEAQSFLEKREQLNWDVRKKALAAKVTAAQAEVSSCRDKITQQTTLGMTVNKQIKALQGLGAECPTCGQEVTPATLTKHIQELDGKLLKIAETLEILKAEKLSLDKDLTKVTDDFQKKCAEHDDIESHIKDVTANISKVKYLITSLTAQLKAKEAELEKISHHDSGLGDWMAETVKQRDKLIAERVQIQKARADRRGEVEAVNFWVDGFKEVQHYIYGGFCKSMSFLGTSYLKQLGLDGGWGLSVSFEHKLKSSDKLVPEIEVRVKSPVAPLEVPVSLWSGGELQRMNLAMVLAFASLSQKQTASWWNLRVWDEPGQNLSAKGMDDFLNYLKLSSVKEGKINLMIDHRVLPNERMNGQMYVTKDKAGLSTPSAWEFF